MNVHRAAPAAPFSRICRDGFTTFIVRTYEDIVRYFFLTIAPPAVTTALYFAVFGALIGHRIGSVGGFRYMQYIALLPAWAQKLSLADPIFYMVDLFRYGMLGTSEVRVGISVPAMLLVAVAMFGVAVTLMQRGVGIRD